MDMAAIFINGPWPFEQTFNTPVTEDSTWILKKTGVTEEKSFKRVDGRTDDDGRRTASDHNSLSWAVLKWAKKTYIFENWMSTHESQICNETRLCGH